MGSILPLVSMSPALALNLRIKSFCSLWTSPCAHAHMPSKNAAPLCLHVFTTIKVVKRLQGKHRNTRHTSRYVVTATYFPLRVAICVCARGRTSSSTDPRVTSTAPLVYLRHFQIHWASSNSRGYTRETPVSRETPSKILALPITLHLPLPIVSNMLGVTNVHKGLGLTEQDNIKRDNSFTYKALSITSSIEKDKVSSR